MQKLNLFYSRRSLREQDSSEVAGASPSRLLNEGTFLKAACLPCFSSQNSLFIRCITPIFSFGFSASQGAQVRGNSCELCFHLPGSCGQRTPVSGRSPVQFCRCLWPTEVTPLNQYSLRSAGIRTARPLRVHRLLILMQKVQLEFYFQTLRSFSHLWSGKEEVAMKTWVTWLYIYMQYCTKNS